MDDGGLVPSESTPLFQTTSANSICSITKLGDENEGPRESQKIALAHFCIFLSILGLTFSIIAAQVLSVSVPDFECNAWGFSSQVVLINPILIVK